MQITSEPLYSDPCARLKIQIPRYSISWGCPKIVRHCDPISLLLNTFGIHLEPGCKSHEQIIHYHTAKNVQKQATVLLNFQTNSSHLPRKDFLQSDQCYNIILQLPGTVCCLVCYQEFCLSYICFLVHSTSFSPFFIQTNCVSRTVIQILPVI